jgi:DNA-binding LacI/PurR family transcriptional regulator
MAVTLRQVADEAGVSIATVSLVLAGRGDRYRDETCVRVRAAAERLGYRPNASARFMQRGRFGIVGLLNPVDHRLGTLPHGMVEGATRALERHDRYLLLVRLERSRLLGGPVPAVLAERMTDGFLVNLHLRVRAEEEAAVDRLGVPCVWLNHKRGDACVHPDDEGAGRLLAERLLAAGHRRLAWADCSYGDDPDPEHYSALDRRQGFIAACAAAGAPCQVRLTRGWTPPERRMPWALDWLRPGEDRPTAIATGNEDSAVTVATAALSLGLQVGAGLCLVTIHNQPVFAGGRLIPTALVPVEAVGERAVELLLARIDGRNDGPAPGPVPFVFAEGAGIAPPG